MDEPGVVVCTIYPVMLIYVREFLLVVESGDSDRCLDFSCHLEGVFQSAMSVASVNKELNWNLINLLDVDWLRDSLPCYPCGWIDELLESTHVTSRVLLEVHQPYN